MEQLRIVVVVVIIPLLLLVVEFSSGVARCPGSVGDEVPAAVKQEAGPPPVGCVAPHRPDALLVNALRLRSFHFSNPQRGGISTKPKEQKPLKLSFFLFFCRPMNKKLRREKSCIAIFA